MAKSDKRVKDVDKGYENVRRRISESNDTHVTVGFHADENDSEQVQVASVHEFGAPRANIPERSFLRSTVDEKRKDYRKLWAKLLALAIGGDMSIRTVFRLVGERARADVQQKIVDVQRPPLQPETIEQKKRKSGKDQIKMVDGQDTGNPLIDTGNMRQSVNYKIHD